MKVTIAVLVSAVLILRASTSLLAKATTTKVTISGVGLKTPIEISNSEIVANFTVWTRTADHGLIIDWSHGPVRETPNTLRRYRVSFYAGAPPNERLVYVVYYVFNPDAEAGYVYLPGESDEYYRLNVHSIFRGEEGKWFPAWNAWERVARPLIEKAERTNLIQP